MKNLLLLTLALLLVGCGGNVPTPTAPAQTTQVAGFYTGTFTSNFPNSPSTGGVNVTLTQSGANVAGTGQVQATCFTAFTANLTVTGSNVSGPLATNDAGKTNVNLDAFLDANGRVTHLQGTYQVTSGACAGDSGLLRLKTP